MQLRLGTTRAVLLVGPYAIKFIRIRPLFPFIRLLVWAKEGRLMRTFRLRSSEYGDPVRGYLATGPLLGLIANLNEYRLYRRFPSGPFAQTFFSFLGIINVQRRGSAVTDEELPRMLFGYRLEDMPDLDLRHVNFCRIDGSVVLADYGNEKLNAYLLQPSTSPVVQPA